MIYEEGLKEKLDNVLKAFEGYIESQDYFDIAYSRKIGYFKVLVKNPGDEGPKVIDTPEAMLDILFNEIINDVIFSPENPMRTHEELVLTEYEEAESRRRISVILDTMEDEEKVSYMRYLNDYITAYQENGRRCGCE